jgi:hypothetical protein
MHEHPIDFASSRFLGLVFVPSWTFEIQIGDRINNHTNADQAGDRSLTLSWGRFNGIQSPQNSVDTLINLARLHDMKGTGQLTSPKMIIVIAANRSRVPTSECGTKISMPLFCCIPRGLLPDQLDSNMRMWVTISTSSPTAQKICLSLAPMGVLPKAVRVIMYAP